MGEDATIALITNCRQLQKLDSHVEYLEISSKNCKKTETSFFSRRKLNTLAIDCQSIKFPTIEFKTSLKKVSIIDPILNDVPKFIYQLPDLESLVLFLKNDVFDNQQMKKLEMLGLGIEKLFQFPNFILDLNHLNFKRKEEYEKKILEADENIKFLISLGANPDNCDHDNRSCLEILRVRYKVEFIAKSNIEELLVKLI